MNWQAWVVILCLAALIVKTVIDYMAHWND